MEEACNTSNTKEDIEKQLLKEKLEALEKINEEYRKYLVGLVKENQKKKAHIELLENENTQ